MNITISLRNEVIVNSPYTEHIYTEKPQPLRHTYSVIGVFDRRPDYASSAFRPQLVTQYANKANAA